MQEVTLLSVPQHIIKYVFRLPRWFGFGLIAGFAAFLVSGYSIWITLVSALALFAIGCFLEWRRYKKSTLDITNHRVYLSVVKGMSGGFEAGLHYPRIRHCGFRREHILHTITGAGTLYVSSEGAHETVGAEWVPDVERICKIVNWLLILPEHQRNELKKLPDGM